MGRILGQMMLVYACVMVLGWVRKQASGSILEPSGFQPMKMRTRHRMTFQTGKNRCEVTKAALTSVCPLPRAMSPAGLLEPG